MNIDNPLVKRLKSLAWRAGMMAAAVFLSVVAESLSSLELSPAVTVVLGLILGEVSKFLNSKAV